MQKYGVITFSYDGFDHFGKDLARHGHFTANLGDSAQSFAARALFKRLGHCGNVVSVDRDTLVNYEGPPVSLLMNAVFRPTCFPLPKAITPIYLGFNAKADTLPLIAPYLKAHEPIGCRDTATAEFLTQLGIASFVSGCVTLTLPKRQITPGTGLTYFVYGAGNGRLPMNLFNHAPPHVLDGAEIIFHRLPLFEYPLGKEQQCAMETYEIDILHKLKNRARLVVTPLHHVAAPCMAMGIPTVICRKKADARFSLLSQMTPIYEPETFGKIDWEPAPVDVTTVAQAYVESLKRSINFQS